MTKKPWAKGRRRRWPAGTRLTALLVLALGLSAAARGQSEGDSSRFSDTPTPLSPGTFPARPAPVIEIGQNPFLGNGYIAPGFVIPTGSVWQPVFIAYGDVRTALQTFDNGTTQTTEWANRLDLFGNLYFTPTERILVGFRPFDTAGQSPGGVSSGYRFKPGGGKYVNGLNGKLTTGFFEGDFGSLFHNLDPRDVKSLDYGFAIGRQNLVSQDGLLMNDTMDAIGVTRSSLFLLGSDASHVTALYGWNNISRGNNLKYDDAHLFGLLSSFDYVRSTIDLDLLYVQAPDRSGGDGLYGGAGLTRRFDYVNATVRVMTSQAVYRQSAPVGTGTLVFTQFSLTPPRSDNLLYWDTFLAIDNFTSAARDPDVGGPLGQTGLLFASAGIGSYGAALANGGHDATGSIIGYQMYFANRRDQLVIELGGRANTKGPDASKTALGASWQQAFGRHTILVFQGFAGQQENAAHSYGLRSELLVKF
jgi:hypothetical protein